MKIPAFVNTNKAVTLLTLPAQVAELALGQPGGTKMLETQAMRPATPSCRPNLRYLVNSRGPDFRRRH